MKWSYWISLYIDRFCVARGLRTSTLEYYEAALRQFSEWIRVTRADRPPDLVTARDVLEYLQHLRDDRGNGDSAVNSAVESKSALERMRSSLSTSGVISWASSMSSTGLMRVEAT